MRGCAACASAPGQALPLAPCSSEGSEVGDEEPCCSWEERSDPESAGPAGAAGSVGSGSEGPGGGGRAAAVAAHFRAARQRFELGGGLPCQISGLELDEDTISFRLEGHEGDFSLFVSESYPAGESLIYGPDDWEMPCCGTVDSILDRFLETYSTASTRKRAIGALDSDDGASDHADQSPRSDASWHDVPLDEPPMEPTLRAHVDAARRYLGADAVNCTAQADSWRIRIRVALVVGDGPRPSEPLLDETTARAWGVATGSPVHLVLQAPIRGYMQSQSMPRKIVTSAYQVLGEAFQLEQQLLNILGDFCDFLLLRSGSGCHGVAAALPGEEASFAEYARKKEELKCEARCAESQGFLVQVAKYLRLRLPTAHEYCAICDQPFGRTPMLMRTVCARELCTYQLQEFGEHITTALEVNMGAEITDLLFCMFARAALSERREIILDPYPSCCDSSGKELVFNPRCKDFTKVAYAVAELMKIRKAFVLSLGAGWTVQKSAMTHEGWELLRWIVSSNRSYLAPLQENQRIRAFNTPFQYLLLSAPHDREKRFQQLKAQFGSEFAYHGSGAENWHSILRHGLKNCSHTKYQTHGAAYGSGVYLSPKSHLSLAYSMRAHSAGPVTAAAPKEHKHQTIGNRFVDRMEQLFMLAVCEVISHESLRKHDNGVWVMPNEEMVMTRFFIVFTDMGCIGNVDINGVAGELQACMESLGVGITDSGCGPEDTRDDGWECPTAGGLGVGIP